MTTTDIESLMNRYFDNDLTDAEEGILFLHLGSSQESRSVFAALKSVHGALQHPAGVTYPVSLDRKLGALNAGQNDPRPQKKSITLSVPSAILSGVLIFMMSILFFLTVAPKEDPMNNSRANEQAMMMLPYSSPQVNHQ